MWKQINIISLLTFILIEIIVCDNVEVNIKQGVLLGKKEETFLKNLEYYAFVGVPFAEPPVDKLRFMDPIPHQGWDDKYKAYDNKPTCLQFNSRMRMGEPFGISGSEDCLYLSIFTPKLAGSAPVIVFEYNDNFRTGFNGTKTYSPDFFIEEDVIVVTISHRLGVFGYLTTEDEVIPGNFGLKDFILGLQWIKENIKQFGGDPERVTLMGNRGGAALNEMLLYSQQARNLFSAAIIQSGTAMESTYFYDNPRRKSFELGEQMNITTNDSKQLLEELQKVDAKELISKEINVLDDEISKKYQRNSYPFTPTIEHHNTNGILKFLPENGKVVNDVPILIGFNSQEGKDLISHLLIRPKLLSVKAEEQVLQFPLRTKFRFDRETSVFKEATREIVEYYFKDKSIHYGNLEEYAVYAGDSLQSYASNYAAKKLAVDLESPVFYYMFDFRGQLNENSEHIARYATMNIGHTGGTNGDELCYLHICSRIIKTYKGLMKLVSEQAEIKVLKNMVRLWTNFAKTRNPTPSKDDNLLKGLIWKPLNKNDENLNYLHISKKLSMKSNPLGERAQFWDQFLDKYSKMAVDGVVLKEIRDEL